MGKQTALERSEARRNMMLEGKLLRVIPVVALPQVAAMLVDSLYNLADTYFVSQLGQAATAAVAVNDSLMHIIRAIALGFGMGAASYISRLLGAKRDEEASRAASTNLFTTMLVVALVAVVFFCFLSPLVSMMGATPSSKGYSMVYARWILVFSPITAATVCLSQTLRSEGSTTFAMIGSVSGCVINVALDPIFIYLLGLGVAGAAIATGISKVISLGILLYPYLSQKSILRLSPRLFKPGKVLYGEIARMGVPNGLRSGMMTVSTIVINNVAGGFGDVALAAVSVSNKCMKLVASAVLGFGQGFQPIAGYCWGAKRYGRLRRAFSLTAVIGVSIGAVLGLLLGIFAPQVIRLFNADAAMSEIGVVLIRTQCVVLPLHVLVPIITGLFQGMGKSFPAAVLGLSRQLLSLIPCVLILTWLFQLDGLTCAQAVADVISFGLAICFALPVIRELKRLEAGQEEEACGDTQAPATKEAVV